MDWNQLAVETVALLSPFVSEAVRSAAKQSGSDFYSWIKARLSTDGKATEALDALAADPDSPEAQRLLSESVASHATADPGGFGAELVRQLDLVMRVPFGGSLQVANLNAEKVVVFRKMIGNITL